jgi:hypothetical protein
MDQVQHSKQQFFISYARKDKAIALRLKADLEHLGFQIWLDLNEILPGQRWDDSIRNAIKQSCALLYLASPNSRASDNVANEIDLAANVYKRPILPLWVDGTNKWGDIAIFGFSRIQFIDLRSDLYSEGLESLVERLRDLRENGREINPLVEGDPNIEDDGGTAMPIIQQCLLFLSAIFEKIRKSFSLSSHHDATNSASDPNQGASSSRSRNPYKGLYAFAYADAEDFFGRERLVGEMVQEVKHIFSAERHDSQSSRCMLVIGASGAGKSSVVMAGLLPTLLRCQDIPEVKRWLFLDPVSPGEHPIDRLIHALKLPYLNKTQSGVSSLAHLSSAALRQELTDPSARGLHNLLQSLTPDAQDRVVLVIDQLEELFAPAVDPVEREMFINLLFATATEPYSRVLIIVTLRADFYDYILKYPRLFSVMKSHKIDIPPMTSQELRDVIDKPAQLPKVNVTFDPDLVGDLIFEMRGRPGALPLLQFVLEKLFDLREDNNLTRRSYDELGGLQGSIDRHADNIFNALPSDEHREYARYLFTNKLIHIMESPQELSSLESGEEIIRRRVTRAELQLDEPQNVVARQTIDAFTQARLLTARSAMRHSTRLEDSTYEISHEVLINAWQRLNEWIKDDRQDIYLGQRLRSHATQWHEASSHYERQAAFVDQRVLKQLQSYSHRKRVDSQEKLFIKYNARYYRNRTIGYLLIWGGSLIFFAMILASIYPVMMNRFFPDPSIVTSLSESGPGSLSRAIVSAKKSGTTITFASGLKGTLHLTSDLLINKNITISGPTDATVTISSDNTGKIIAITSGSNVTFNNLTFANSYTHKKSFIMNDGNLTMNHCQMMNNSSYGNGGAIANTGKLSLNDTTFSSNIVSGDGGAIYNRVGSVNVNGSKIVGNLAYSNGGGIYSVGGQIEVSDSQLAFNSTLDVAAQNNYGGAIDVVDSPLFMSGTTVSNNYSQGYGGGLAVQGSEAVISDTTIDHNHADKMGGGIIVAINTNDNRFGLATLNNITVTNTSNALYFIGQNTGGDKLTSDIAGERIPTGSVLQIASVKSASMIGTGGNPAPINPPQLDHQIFVGFADINEFCQNKGSSYGEISPDVTISCYTLLNKLAGKFSGQQVCQEQEHAIVDRLVDYPGPFALQCYKNVRFLGPIGNNPADFARVCSSDGQDAGLYDNQSERTTAYDWRCQPKQRGILPRSLSVANACAMKYGIPNAFDRLVDYSKPDGWECWAPLNSHF